MTYVVISVRPYPYGPVSRKNCLKYQVEYRRPNGSINYAIIEAKDELDAYARGLKHVARTAAYAARRRQETIDRILKKRSQE